MTFRVLLAVTVFLVLDDDLDSLEGYSPAVLENVLQLRFV